MLDTDSQANWTPIRIQGGHFSQGMRNGGQHNANTLADRIGENPGNVDLAG